MTGETTAKPARRSGRAWRMAGLILLSIMMAVPLVVIGQIAVERSSYSHSAAYEIAQSWGGRQTLSGPVVIVPVELTRTREIRNDDGTVTERLETVAGAPLVLMPEDLAIDGTVTAETRVRGIYEIPVYVSRHEIFASFDATRLEGLAGEGERVLWDRAELVLGIGETRGLRGAVTVTVDGAAMSFEPGSGTAVPGGAGMNGVHVVLGDPRAVGEVRIGLAFNGSQGLYFTPAGRQTTVTLGSDWPHPSFAGQFLPVEREVTEAGFTAKWEVPLLARSVPQAFRDTGYLQSLGAAAFGFQLFQPVDLYHKAERAAKYGILFIALTFCAVFLMEGAARHPTHVAQYALIGAAQCVFFLLLLSLAEQIGFGPAYLAATLATIALLTFYAISALGLGKRGWLFAAALVLLYGVMYVILMSEDQALLAGSLLAFGAVAATMYATRNEDWGATLRMPEALRAPPPPKQEA